MVFGTKFADDLFNGRDVEQQPKSPLHRRIRTYVLGILVVNVILLILVQTALLQPSVESLEQALIDDDQARIENSIHQEAKSLGLKCREWSAWDDPYEVIQKPGSEELRQFVADNLIDDYFAAGQIALMAMVDPSGSVVWGEVHDTDGKLIEPLVELSAFFGRDAAPFYRFADTGASYEGIVATRLGPMILAARPQLNGKFEGPIRGAFLMGKFLDDRLAVRLSEQTRVNFRRHDALREPNVEPGIGTIRAGERLTVMRDVQTADAYAAIGDDLDQVVYVAHATIPRTVSAQAARFFSLMRGSVVLVSLIAFLCLGFFLRRDVVRPIVAMKRSLRTISESKEVTARISRTDPSEIGLLAGDFHRLLDKTARDMTFMQATEEALRRNEHVLRLMAEHTPNGFLLVDVSGARVLYHNRLFCRIWGPDENDAEGSMCDPTVDLLSERIVSVIADSESARAFDRTLRDPGDASVIEEEWPLRDGRTLRTFSTRLQSGDGVVIGRYYVFEDITVRKRVEEELVQRGLLLEAVATSSNLLISSSREDEAVMHDVLAVLGTAVDADRAYIFEAHALSGDGRPRLSQRFEWVGNGTSVQIDNPELQNLLFEDGFSRWYELLRTGSSIRGRVADFPESERGLLEPQGIFSLMAVPIAVEGRFWGFIGFDDCRKVRDWTDMEESILVVAAGGIGADIARKAYEKKLVESVSELERMNRLMRGRENRVLELKAVVNELHTRLGERPRYTVPESYYGAEERRIS